MEVNYIWRPIRVVVIHSLILSEQLVKCSQCIFNSLPQVPPTHFFCPVSRWLSEEGLAAMLLSNRPSSRRLLGCITLVTFCVVIFQLLGLTKSVTFEVILATIPLPEEKLQATAIPEKIWY
jgi:hypothetical protein